MSRFKNIDSRLLAGILSLIFLALLSTFAISRETPLGTVAGQVFRNDNGRPIVGARVYHPTRDTYVKTDQQGKYTLDGVPEGKHNIRVYAKGFNSSYHSNVRVKEGKTTDEVNFAMIRRRSTYYIYAYQKVFSPGNKPSVDVRGYLVKKIRFKVFKIDPLSYLFLLSNPRQLKDFNTSNLKPVHQSVYVSKLNEDGDFSGTQVFPIEENGLYIIEAEAVGGSLRRKTWLLKSDLELIFKRSPGEILVYAQRFSDGKPVKNASIRVYRKDELIDIGKTDEDGIFQYSYNSQKPVRVTANIGKSFAFAGIYYSSSPRDNKTYLYTDRPVYRPGQKVHFKGIVRRKSGPDYMVPRGVPVEVEVYDNRSTNIFRKVLYTNKRGTFNSSFTLGEEPSLGTYSLRARVGDDKAYYSFKVAEYRKPEYKVEVETDKDHYVAGDRIKVKINSDYYFGAPVKGAKFNLTVFESAYRWRRARWTGYMDDRQPGYGGIMFEKSGVLDENGEAEVIIPTGKIDYSKILGIEAEVTDISGRAVTGSTSAPLSVGEFAIYAYTDKLIYTPGEEIKLNVEALNYDEKPVKNQQLNVKPVRVTYEEVKVIKKIRDSLGRLHTYEEYKLKEKETPIGETRRVVTDEKGKVELRFTLQKEGRYEFRVSARDSRGNKITYTAHPYISGMGDGMMLSEADLKIITDKDKYKPGDKVKAVITCSEPGTYVLLTIEGRKIFWKKVVQVKKGSLTLNLPMKEEYFPNVFLTASAIKDMDMITDTADIQFNREQKKLKIAIETDKERYKPGEKARYKVKVTDLNGNPVNSAEISLGVVDQAIYAISPDRTPDIHEFFWGYDYNYVDTSYSFARDYSGGFDKFDRSKIRKDFKDTAFWSPVLVTDRTGVAVAEFVMPDNLTTWVATVRCASADTRVGSAVSTVISTKDLLVRLLTPRFLVQKDRIYIGGVVHNFTKKDQKVQVKLETEGVKMVDESQRQEVIKSDDSDEFYWEVEVEEPGEAVFTLMCQGEDARDGMQLKVPVYPFGIEEMISKSGIMETNQRSARITIEVPAKVIEKATNMQILLSPSLAASMMENLDYLIKYPYGCVEQTMSSFLPAITVYRAFSKINLDDQGLRKKIPEVVRKGLSKLYSLQHYDGGWGWWEHDETHPYMTAYVVMGLKQAQKNGFPVKRYVLKRGISALKKISRQEIKPIKTMGEQVQQGEAWNQRAYILYVLYRIGDPDRKRTLEAFEHKDKMNEYALALLAMTLDGMGETRRAGEILKVLDEKSIRKGGECHWEGRTFTYSWVDNDVESTAYCLLAYLQIHPEDPRIKETIRWLIRQRRGKSYHSTKDTAAVVYALTDYLLKTGEYSPDYRLRVGLNDKSVVNTRINQPILPPDIAENNFDYREVKSGENTISFDKMDPGVLYYHAKLSYFPIVENVEPKSNGIEVSRSYQLLTRQKRNGKIEEVTSPLPERPLKRGEKLRVIITVRSDKDYQFVIIEDPLPAGFEVDIPEGARNWGSLWWCQQEVRDEKVSFFTRRLNADKKMQLTYDLRCEMFGKVNALPTLAYCMYEPEVRGHSASDRLTVEREK